LVVVVARRLFEVVRCGPVAKYQHIRRADMQLQLLPKGQLLAWVRLHGVLRYAHARNAHLPQAMAFIPLSPVLVEEASELHSQQCLAASSSSRRPIKMCSWLLH